MCVIFLNIKRIQCVKFYVFLTKIKKNSMCVKFCCCFISFHFQFTFQNDIYFFHFYFISTALQYHQRQHKYGLVQAAGAEKKKKKRLHYIVK